MYKHLGIAYPDGLHSNSKSSNLKARNSEVEGGSERSVTRMEKWEFTRRGVSACLHLTNIPTLLTRDISPIQPSTLAGWIIIFKYVSNGVGILQNSAFCVGAWKHAGKQWRIVIGLYVGREFYRSLLFLKVFELRILTILKFEPTWGEILQNWATETIFINITKKLTSGEYWLHEICTACLKILSQLNYIFSTAYPS